MPERQRRPRPRPPLPRRQRRPRFNPGLDESNADLQQVTTGAVDAGAVDQSFQGEAAMTGFLQDASAQDSDDVALSGGDAAVRAAYLTYLEGVALHGEDASWETTGSNRGPLVDQIEADNNAGGGGYEWCGMFIGQSYKKAGIRDEILRRLVFWSGYRLHLFFTQGKYIDGTFGDWCQAHQTLQLGSQTGDQRKAALDSFAPQPGDIALFRSDYSHVGMVTSYDANTGTLEIIEGNRGNRVQATAYDTGDGQITFLGRFNDSDYEPGGSVDEEVLNSTAPDVEHTGAGSGSIR